MKMTKIQTCRITVLATAIAVTLAAVLTAVPGASAAPRTTTHSASTGFRHACAPAKPGRATCFAVYRSAARAPFAAKRQLLRPADIAAAYRLTPSHSQLTAAIVDAQDDPLAEKNLATYRAHYHLPACTTRNGCFRKVNQKGVTKPMPDPDPDWGVEISLDLDAVSATCPSCHILLVEADSPEDGALGTAVNTAVRLGAKVVSNSYGGTEYPGTMAEARKYYTHPGVAIVASSGDEGFGIPNAPAVMPSVIGVGGTTLTRSSAYTRGWSETAWQGGGSGCSAYVAKPRFQTDTHCPGRVVSDISAVADPDSGFLVYDTFGLGSDGGFLTAGGTSLSAPLVSGMIGRADNPSRMSNASHIYTHRTHIFDVQYGANGHCGNDYLCHGKKGYDAPTGVGSPNGLGAL